MDFISCSSSSCKDDFLGVSRISYWNPAKKACVCHTEVLKRMHTFSGCISDCMFWYNKSTKQLFLFVVLTILWRKRNMHLSDRAFYCKGHPFAAFFHAQPAWINSVSWITKSLGSGVSLLSWTLACYSHPSNVLISISCVITLDTIEASAALFSVTWTTGGGVCSPLKELRFCIGRCQAISIRALFSRTLNSRGGRGLCLISLWFFVLFT